jgi:hypothetical protein
MHSYTKHKLEMMKAREWTGKIIREYYETAYSRQVHHDTAYSRQIKCLISRAQSNDAVNINNNIKRWSF